MHKVSVFNWIFIGTKLVYLISKNKKSLLCIFNVCWEFNFTTLVFQFVEKKILTFAKIIFAFIIQSVYIWHRMCITVKRLLSTHKKYTVLYWVGPNSINTTFWLQVEENLMVGWFCFTGRNCAVPNQFHLLQGWYWVESVKLKNKLVWSWCWPHS